MKEESKSAMEKRRIAVIGGGPKAVALAVKANVLRALKLQDTEVVIFEKNVIGSAWDGNHGYSDGEQLLCTLAERDVGFPYQSLFGEKVDTKMRAYSWFEYVGQQEQGISRWIDAGRKTPKHESFVAYIRWALKRARNKPVFGEVVQIEEVDRQWRVTYVPKSASASRVHPDLFDGVVITGPGPARALPILDASTRLPVECPKVFNGEDFWKRRKKVLDLIPTLGEPDVDSDILIIGGGGTAAASLAWLLSNGCMKHSIKLVASNAVLHTRVDSLFENRMFSEEGIWKTLAPESQNDFFNRLNRGVVWASVIDKVVAAENLTIHDGQVKSIAVETIGSRQNISVAVEQGNREIITFRPTLVIDATGFDPRWFKKLISEWPERVSDAALEANLGQELQYKDVDWTLPLMHVPMLSKRVGPGFASLMVLGAMSDRILKAYRRTASPTA